MTPLVEVTSGPGSPKTLVMARASARSLSGVEVPWALMWPTSAGVIAGIGERQLHAGDRAGAVGRRRGDVVRVRGTGRPGQLRVDGRSAGDGAVPFLEHEGGGALGHDEAVAAGVEGAGVTRGGQRGHVGERGERDGVHAGLGAAADGHVAAPARDEARRGGDGMGARRRTPCR